MRSALSACLMVLLILSVQVTAHGQPAADAGGERAVIKAFRDLRPGLSLDEVKRRLEGDPYFNYRGDPDVYFLPAKEQLLIECSGNVYIRRAYFQFVDKKLYTLILDLDDSRVDYFTLFTQFNRTYGAYVSFSPQTATWEKAGLRLALEKPLTVKYIDLAVFERLKEKGRAQVSDQEKSLADFLREF